MSEKIILSKGIISTTVTELDLDRFEAVRIHQGWTARLLNFGTVTVSGTGGVRLTLDDLDDPGRFKNSVLEYAKKNNAMEAERWPAVA